MTSSRFLFRNGVVLHSPDVPPVSTFLESHPGAYTTTRTHNNAARLLFWERHLQRLSNSAKILFDSSPQLFFNFGSLTTTSTPIRPSMWDSGIKTLVNDAAPRALAAALRERGDGEELAVTALVSGDVKKLGGVENSGEKDSVFGMLDVFVHVGFYVPPVFGSRENGARLAVVGRGRDVSEAKYSDWVRIFQENSEVNGKYVPGYENICSFEVQTTPIGDGVLPGVIRQVVIDVCYSMGIPVKEVAPSWSNREFWLEAFITSSLRILQHVETILVPSSWESLQHKTLTEISWEKKNFGDNPGTITAMIQKEIMERACMEGHLL